LLNTVSKNADITIMSDVDLSIILANELRRRGKFFAAIDIYTPLLKEHPEQDEMRTTLLNNCGALYHDIGNLDQALSLYQESLHLSRAVLGSEHPSIATTLNNMAAVYEARGDLDQALSLYQESSSIMKHAFGNDHVNVASILNNQAGCLYQLGRYNESIETYELALSIAKRYLGPESVGARKLQANLSVALSRKASGNSDYDRTLTTNSSIT
jgi:tetratricopeptide (TPR) repeat protein